MSDYKMMPVEPTPEMVSAAEDAYMPFGDMELAIRMALLAAPAVQGEPVGEWLSSSPPRPARADQESEMNVTYQNGWAVPAGWKLVPEKPTYELESEVGGVRMDEESFLHEYADREKIGEICRAVVKYSPPPPKAPDYNPSPLEVSVIGMPEFDALLDHIYEEGTSSEGAVHLANKLVRVAIQSHITHARNAQPAPDVACSQSRESAMVVLEQGPDGTPAVWCDPEIADLVSALNKAGIRTVASCRGHGHRPGNIMLSDGRELAIARDFDEARKIDAMFPGINGEPPMVDVKALVRLDDYEALQAELERWKNGSTIRDEQNEELHQYVSELKTEIEKLRTALAESRANDRQAMYYLNQVREIVGGDDFPDMVERCRELVK